MKTLHIISATNIKLPTTIKNKLFSILKINYYFCKRTHLKVNNTDIFYNVIMINYKKAAVLKCLKNLSERPSVDLFATFISLEF